MVRPTNGRSFCVSSLFVEALLASCRRRSARGLRIGSARCSLSSVPCYRLADSVEIVISGVQACGVHPSARGCAALAVSVERLDRAFSARNTGPSSQYGQTALVELPAHRRFDDPGCDDVTLSSISSGRPAARLCGAARPTPGAARMSLIRSSSVAESACQPGVRWASCPDRDC